MWYTELSHMVSVTETIKIKFHISMSVIGRNKWSRLLNFHMWPSQQKTRLVRTSLHNLLRKQNIKFKKLHMLGTFKITYAFIESLLRETKFQMIKWHTIFFPAHKFNYAASIGITPYGRLTRWLNLHISWCAILWWTF